MGLARAEGSVRLPDALRDVLLNYPGQRPLFDIHVRMNLSRELDIHVIGTDYRGRVVVPEARTSSMLVFAGFSAWAVFGSALDALRWSVTLGELSLKVPGDDWVASSLDKLGFSGHLLRDEPGWRGSVKASLGGWTVESAEVHLRLGEISLGAELGIRHTEGGQKKPSCDARRFGCTVFAEAHRGKSRRNRHWAYAIDWRLVARMAHAVDRPHRIRRRGSQHGRRRLSHRARLTHREFEHRVAQWCGRSNLRVRLWYAVSQWARTGQGLTTAG